MILQFSILLLSIIALYWGAEFTLEAADKIGRALGMSPLVIGLLLIGFGTSLPEFFVSQMASYQGQVDIALGNILGSNIANLFLILGVSGLLTTLDLRQADVKRQVFIHLGLTLTLFYVLTFVGINLIATGIFTLFFLLYLFDTFRHMNSDEPEEEDSCSRLSFKDFMMLIFGFVLLYFGGDYLVSSGTKLGVLLGISSFVISAILVAFGTSFPELVTAILACKKNKDTNLIVGNIIGSNIFNVAFVLGSIGVYDIEVSNFFKDEMIALFFASIMLVLLVVAKKSFARLAGLIFLSCYAFMIFSWLN